MVVRKTIVLLLTFAWNNAFAGEACESTLGQAGRSLTLQYSGTLEGNLAERRSSFLSRIELAFPLGSSVEFDQGSISVLGQTVNVCASNKLGPMLVGVLVEDAGFQIVENPVVDATL